MSKGGVGVLKITFKPAQDQRFKDVRGSNAFTNELASTAPIPSRTRSYRRQASQSREPPNGKKKPKLPSLRLSSVRTSQELKLLYSSPPRPALVWRSPGLEPPVDPITLCMPKSDSTPSPSTMASHLHGPSQADPSSSFLRQLLGDYESWEECLALLYVRPTVDNQIQYENYILEDTKVIPLSLLL
ncbi:hypothetical protein M5K25_020969 [Dendrobium thyrsiflorum]|uniref:Uncharacterized protein n=1 Tax=Dendrobium thyrsiflorum TaxID=117978 RepID=A0ABD0UI69_DENTH